MTIGDGWEAEAAWFRSGLGRGDSGALDRELPVGKWVVPAEVEATGGSLHYRWGTPEERPKPPPQEPGVLDDLLAATSSDRIDAGEIVGFAERWGVIECCEHGLPATHRLPISSTTGPRCAAIPLRPGHLRMTDWRQEPLTVWSDLGRRARALLTVAAAVHDEQPAPLETWQAAAWGLPTHSGSERRFIPAADRPALAAAVNMWLNVGGVVTDFVWAGDGPTLSLRPQSLTGAVALQLAFSVARVNGLRLCSSCGRPHTPVRLPARDRRSYCQDCGLRAARRDAARAYRQRKKERGR